MIDKYAFREFFVKRIVELYDRNSLDSNRVRCHNIISLMEEFVSVCIGWKENRIKTFETVKGCIDELETCINEDQYIVWASVSKSVLTSFLTDLKKSQKKDQVGKIVFAVKKILEENKNSYIESLKNGIEKMLFSTSEYEDNRYIPLMSDFDYVISSYACELLNRGYSKPYLHDLAKKIEIDNFVDSYEIFKSNLTFEKKRFVVIIRLYLEGPSKDVAWPDDFVETIPTDLIDDYFSDELKRKIPDSRSNIRFVIEEIEDYDPIRALFSAKAKVQNLVDFYHVGMNRLNVKFVGLYVCSDFNNNKTAFYRDITSMSPLDGVYPNQLNKTIVIREKLLTIINSHVLDNEAESRLRSACRHLRVANNSQDIEQCFINYWIALEFLYSSPSNDENTIGRLKENLVNIMICGYANRNFKHLNHFLKRKGFVIEENIWELNSIDELVGLANNHLLKFKLLKVKSLFWSSNTSNAVAYLKRHKENVEQQIVRIYRVRNELIHEAAISQNIERLTSNLRYYLMFTINQMMEFFSSHIGENVQYGMDHFFYEYQIKKEMLEKNPTKEMVMSIPLNFDIVN